LQCFTCCISASIEYKLNRGIPINSQLQILTRVAGGVLSGIVTLSLSAVAVQMSFHSVFWFFVDILPTEVNLVLSQPVNLDAAK
jgi:hypothetical protein